jgi:uncharacterized YccA/Bax inhibitor family protein
MTVDGAALLVFHTDLGASSGSVLSIVLTAVFIAIAAFSLLLNFDAADQMIRWACRRNGRGTSLSA